MVPATRQGWLFLPGLILRPPLMLFGLILGYFVFLAAIGLLKRHLAAAAEGRGRLGWPWPHRLPGDAHPLCDALLRADERRLQADRPPPLCGPGVESAGAPEARTTARGASRAPSPAGIARAGSGRLTGRLRGGSGG